MRPRRQFSRRMPHRQPTPVPKPKTKCAYLLFSRELGIRAIHNWSAGLHGHFNSGGGQQLPQSLASSWHGRGCLAWHKWHSGTGVHHSNSSGFYWGGHGTGIALGVALMWVTQRLRMLVIVTPTTATFSRVAVAATLIGRAKD